MKNRKLLIGVVLVVAILLLGIGYAEITDKTLTISGNAVASPNADNFVVKFTGEPSTSGKGTITAKVTNNTTAQFDVTGLTAKGDTATATYTVVNESPDLSAALSVSSTVTNTEYFKVTSTVNAPKTITAKGTATATATVTVTVELIKTPVNADVTGKVTATLTATPVQPAQ